MQISLLVYLTGIFTRLVKCGLNCSGGFNNQSLFTEFILCANVTLNVVVSIRIGTRVPAVVVANCRSVAQRLPFLRVTLSQVRPGSCPLLQSQACPLLLPQEQWARICTGCSVWPERPLPAGGLAQPHLRWPCLGGAAAGGHPLLSVVRSGVALLGSLHSSQHRGTWGWEDTIRSNN